MVRTSRCLSQVCRQAHWLLLLILFSPGLHAQVEGVASLSDGWRIQSGDNPAWAQPQFDDSSWPVMSLDADAETVAPGWRWYRLRLNLPPQHGPLALLITGPDNSYNVYVDGVAAPQAAIQAAWRLHHGRERIVPLSTTGGPVQLAIRVHYPRVYSEIYGLYLARVLIGPVPAIAARQDLSHDQRLLAFLPSAAINLACILAGCGALLLFSLQRSSREYLWLGLYLILSALSAVTLFAAVSGVIPLAVNNFFGDPLTYPVLVMQIEFTYAFTGRKLGRGWRVYEGLLLAFLLASLLVNLHGIPPMVYLLAEGAANVPVAIMLPIFLCVWWLRGDREAGWLILPSFLPAAGDITLDLSLVSNYQGWTRLDALVRPIYLGPVAFTLDDLADLAFLLAIIFVMLLRFTRVSREQARTAAELAAAREIQQRLVPSTHPAIAGCRMEAAYLPALEVGGDFYQVVEQPGGSSLIVVGDVSGKGLRAAMTGALAIGALRTLAAENLRPAALLQRLNLQILSAEDGGFITCLCTHITGDGTVTAANAGHLAPYRNGEEILLDYGLPLGLTADAEYAETTLQLLPGDTLTLLSDGVVEARSASGELFGFDRTCAISLQSAQQIAEAAQLFGQEDDITVLTLTFAGVSVMQP